MSDKTSGALEVTLSFLLGTATGFILGILFAPASGEETRKKIQERAVETGEKAKEGYEKISKEAEKGIKVVREKTTEGSRKKSKNLLESPEKWKKRKQKKASNY